MGNKMEQILCLLQLLPRDRISKTKNKDQPTKNHKQKINKKIKAMENSLEWILGYSNYCQKT